MMHLFFLAARTLIFRRGSFVLLLVAITGALGLRISNSANICGILGGDLQQRILPSTGHILITASDREPVRSRAALIAQAEAAVPGVIAVPRFAPAVLFSGAVASRLAPWGIPGSEQANHFCGRMLAGAARPHRGRMSWCWGMFWPAICTSA